MGMRELEADRATFAALDDAVARFKAAFGASTDELFAAREDVDRALIRCLIRFAEIHGKPAPAERKSAKGG